MRKTGEPIYLRKHLLALVLALIGTVALPSLYEWLIDPLSPEGRLLSVVLLAAGVGIGLYVMFRDTATNEPERKE